MSTEYTVYEDEKAGIEISLNEHSGKLDLNVTIRHVATVDINDLTPFQVAKIASNMLRAAWYQDEDAVINAIEIEGRSFQMGLSI